MAVKNITKGDKVVWMIVLILTMISLVAISGSTSQLLGPEASSRAELLWKHAVICAVGFLLILACFLIPKKWFETLSKCGFIVSFVLLAILLGGEKVQIENFFKVENINGAVRSIKIFGFQLHVFEIVKVAMVMYLAWASKAWHNDSFRLSKKIASFTVKVKDKEGQVRETEPFAWVGKRFWEFFFYILVPVGAVVAMIIPKGSSSSAMFIGVVMLATLAAGGVKLKHIFAIMLLGLSIVGGAFGLYKISDGKLCHRVGTAISRMGEKPTVDDLFKARDTFGKDSPQYKKILRKIQQPYAAQIAIHEGGLLKRGFGGSTQKYVVPVMYGDFMYSFILEETGFLGGVAIIILYLSLVARGMIIVKNCDDLFDQTAVAGLILLIVGQAFMHIFINLGIGPLSGQTLPLISHGSTAFLCFSIAFGIILAISSNCWREREAEEREADIEHNRISPEDISTDTGDF